MYQKDVSRLEYGYLPLMIDRSIQFTRLATFRHSCCCVIKLCNPTNSGNI